MPASPDTLNNPYAVTPEENRASTTGTWTDDVLLVGPSVSEVTLPQICYATGDTSDLTPRKLTVGAMTTASKIAVTATFASNVGAVAAVLVGAITLAAVLGVSFYGLLYISFRLIRSVRVSAFEARSRKANRRRTIWQAAAFLGLIVAISLGIGGAVFPLAGAGVFVPAFLFTLVYTKYLMSRGELSAEGRPENHVAIKGFAARFHTERRSQEPHESR